VSVFDGIRAKLVGMKVQSRYEDSGRLAVQHAKEADESGLPQGHHLMGVLYEEGIGVPKDEEAAIGYYQKGMAKGVAYSFNRLVRIYEKRAIRLAAEDGGDAARGCYIAAFRIAFMQAKQIHERWGMNRVTCYYYEGLPPRPDMDEKQVGAARQVLGRFGMSYIRQLLDEDPTLAAWLRDSEDRDKVMYDFLVRAANRGEPYALRRLENLREILRQPEGEPNDDIPRLPRRQH
jgi:TPR repeat protein